MGQIKTLEGQLQIIGNPQVAILASRFNGVVVDNLIEGAMKGLVQHGVKEESIHLFRVPGAMELPFLAQVVAGRFAGCIALGAVIRGDTPHFDYVAGECASGITQVGLTSKKPIIFGVLTTDTTEQAMERAGTQAGNKGFEYALNLIEMLNLLQQIEKL